MEIEAPPRIEDKDDLQGWLQKLWIAIQGDHLKGSVTWDPGNIPSNGHEHKEVTVTGAAVGDMVLVSFSLDLTADLEMVGFVSAADTVGVHLTNHGVGATNLAEGTLYARVFKVVT